MEVTKRRILEDLHEQLAEEKRRMSHNRTGRQPIVGWEIPFTDTEKKMELVREMIRGLEESAVFDEIELFAEKNKDALKNPGVRQRIREWQREIMEKGRPDLEELKPGPRLVKMDGGREDVHTL